jgi:hypothetical protein
MSDNKTAFDDLLESIDNSVAFLRITDRVENIDEFTFSGVVCVDWEKRTVNIGTERSYYSAEFTVSMMMIASIEVFPDSVIINAMVDW